MSANGWTDKHIGAMWFILSFVPQATARNKSGKPILLILDGHGSHEGIKIIDLADEHNIIILMLPPHTTHKLQPLDVGVFGPFSRRWIDRCDDIVAFTGSEMRKEDFIKEYMQVRDESFRPSVIKSAFAKSGVWPVNRHVFTDEDYAPSVPYSSEARDVPDLPEFPPTIPILPPPIRKRSRHTHRDASHSDSDSDSDSSSGSDSDSESDSDSDPELDEQPERAALSTQPGPLAASTSTSHFPSPPSLSTRSGRNGVASTLPPTHFYHDPVLFARINRLEAEVETLKAHSRMVESELATSKRKMNVRDGRASKKRKLNVEGRVLNSVEGRRQAVEDDAERAAKDKKKDEGTQRRKDKENARDHNRQTRDPDAPFTGLLTAKNKDDLMDIAWAVKLPEDGTKAVLFERIDKYFRHHTAERESPKFAGLFTRGPRGRRAAAPATNDNAPQASTSRIAPPTPFHDLPIYPDTQPHHPNFDYPFTFVPPVQPSHYPAQDPFTFHHPFHQPPVPNAPYSFDPEAYSHAQPSTSPRTFTDFNSYHDFQPNYS